MTMLESMWAARAEYLSTGDAWFPLFSETSTGSTENLAIEKLMSAMFEVKSGIRPIAKVVTALERAGFPETRIATCQPGSYEFKPNSKATSQLQHTLVKLRVSERAKDSLKRFVGRLDGDTGALVIQYPDHEQLDNIPLEALLLPDTIE